MHEPDPQLVAAAQRGEPGAFEELVRRYQAEVWRLALHLLQDESLVDDVTQDVFVRAYRFLPRYRGESKFSTWLFTITRNCVLDEHRRAGRRRRLSSRLDAEPAATGPDHSLRFEVREAVARLPLELREPVVLIDMFGASYQEVAAMANVPLGTIKSRVHRARGLLADALLPGSKESTNEL